jgi:hypothetical protein
MGKTDYKIGGFVSTAVEDSSLLECNAVSLVAEFPMLQKNTVFTNRSHISGLLKVGNYSPNNTVSHLRWSVSSSF